MSDAHEQHVPIPAWDRHLDQKELSELSPARYRARNDASLARKVAVIEAAARVRTEGSASLPRTMKALRGWFDEERRLWAWGGREVDDPNGRNRDIIARLLAAWATLKASGPDRATEPRQPSLKRQLAMVTGQRNAADAQVVRLLRERNRGGRELEGR